MTTQAQTKKNYKATLNLPQTAFPMEAKLTANEPARLARWKQMGLYEQLMAQRAGAKKWILHDGPPFANGDIHLGHLINKTLKDVILRFRSMQGLQTPYVPGWDCHGLPIEHKIQQDLGPKLRQMSVSEVRRLCHEYAQKYVAIQSEQFQRLGILGEWANPYITMSPQYEAQTLEVFARFVEAGLVYKQLKPVPWSVENQTALADAELEYQDVTDDSIYVEFPLVIPGQGGSVETYLLVWTTTPWTLPANRAVAINRNVDYAKVKYQRNGVDRIGIVAKDLVDRVFRDRQHSVDQIVPATEILSLDYMSPFSDRAMQIPGGPVVHADHVTTTDGTGLVHIAPGHGEEDYITAKVNGLDKVNGLVEVYCPVLADGRFDQSVPALIRGKKVWEANPLIVAELKRLGRLFAEEKITHSYPHDWRSKKPIIFRATEQWFVGIDRPFNSESDPDGLAPKSLRSRAIQAVGFDPQHPVTVDQAQLMAEAGKLQEEARLEDQRLEEQGEKKTPLSSEEMEKLNRPLSSAEMKWVRSAGIKSFVPNWGRNRIRGMLESRPDWCISRQRAWGLPIPVFYNEKGEALLTPDSVRVVAKRFAQQGSDAWFTQSPAQLLADFDPGPQFPRDKLRKESDIFDVWFESGSSWRDVLQGRDNLHFPADLYLEGSDQHRGWFQLSLLLALGATGQAPFKQVLTHGFVVKPDGTKVSKSDKEYVTATAEVNRHGADLLRLWCCSVDYQNDIPASPGAIQEFSDKYRKIRNTLRYLLSNLYDFSPPLEEPIVPDCSLDAMLLYELDTLIESVAKEYNGYQLHRAFRQLHDFCAVQVSTIYATAMKDRLYCDAADSSRRRRCQYVMYKMVDALTRMLAPMLVFTADETWEHIPCSSHNQKLPSVHLAMFPARRDYQPSEETLKDWNELRRLRDAATMNLDGLKKEKGMNKALDAELICRVRDKSTEARLKAYGDDLEDLVGAGFHSFAEPGPEESVVVEMVDRRQEYKACARSWKRRPDVGQDAQYPDLSLRDAAVVRAIERARG